MIKVEFHMETGRDYSHVVSGQSAGHQKTSSLVIKRIASDATMPKFKSWLCHLYQTNLKQVARPPCALIT